MKIIKIALLLILLSLVSCKKEGPITPECDTTTVELSNEWTLDETLFVTRENSDSTVTNTQVVNSIFDTHDHKLEDGVYYQSDIDSNDYIVKGSYSTNALIYSRGSGSADITYSKSINSSGQLVLERFAGSGGGNTYITEENRFNRK